MNKQAFYGNTRPYIQRGIYNLLVTKRKIPVEIVIKCINQYGILNNIKDPRFILDHINWNFESFLNIVSIETGQQFNKNKKVKKRYEDVFEDWYFN